MQDLRPDFRLYPANSLEVLAGLLAAELRQPVPGQSILAPEVVLIPQVAMRRWLQATLAAAHGVAANLLFLTPGEFVAGALQANLGPAGDELDAASLHWRLYAALTDPAVLAQPALAALAAYLSGDDALKPWALAGELAGVFEKYQAWRRDWLLRWQAGADPHDPQALLWRQVASGQDYRARRIQAYLERFGGETAALPVGLPRRVFAFATLNISPDVLRVLATQARVGTLHFYLPTPAQGYWGDLQALAPRRRARGDDRAEPDLFDGHTGENPLLQAWGAAGRDFMAMLGGYEVVHPRAEIEVYADPIASGQRPLAQGGLGDSLLRRMQSDLFRRVRPAVPAPLPALDRTDPSLQVHASHTRLRELQVLHDQLRGLLEDPRFDPPLQPRQIAVLAPDIDPYVPYLEAVFGADPGPARIGYALADTSPLAGEPLAEVFVRLLGLPVSRFGLNETLDLLASPPLAEAAGLDAAAFERLHGWLQAAGARWGLDAEHRARHAAPRDDAYTWQFALDRLLLGHASGSEEDIAGLAPWPALEGSALSALDALIRLLQVLSRAQQALAEAMPPQAWRERLLGLLDALLPQPPSAPGTQRALDRLRKLIDEFASAAQRAGFDAPLPAEVVRAHFSGVLAEADTRAPLLTGGVSVGRMVPMRLLPFRVICLLGMNDGDFPRRDPAAGLNRLTAQLGTDQRRYGDRSTREDDRFLFLQLFASAQDVFYVSYLGADPRDGSVREPSVLVSELIAAAADYHADPGQAAAAMTVRHPLQPFAPAAFGADGDRRQFSYRGQWQPGAGRLGDRRTRLGPWCDAALPVGDALETRVSLDALKRLLIAPAEQFLGQRLGLRLAEQIETSEDLEPLLMPGAGLEKHALQQAVFAALLEDRQAGLAARLRARALLPSGALGRRALEGLLEQTQPYAQAFRHWRGTAQPEARLLEVDLEGLVLHGRLGELYAHGLARTRLGPVSGVSAIRDGLDWLLASAAGLPQPLVQFDDRGDAGAGPFLREPLDAAQARLVLRMLLQLRADGLQSPLPFAPYSGWEYFNAQTAEQALRRAAGKWRGGERQWAEGSANSYQLALRGRDPFADPRTLQQFAHLSFTIYQAVTRGVIHEGFDDGRSFIAEADEAQEDA